MSNIFFTSDTHFYHRNIMQYCPKRSELGLTIDDMNEGLIQRWNQQVGPKDIVYHLGDFTLTTRVELIDPILARLNGRICLVKGNHDKWLRKLDALQHKDKFEWVRQYNKESFSVDNRIYEIVMMHYPLLSWEGSCRGAISLHGHAHGSNDHLNVGTKRLDVGVDATAMGMAPISLERVIELTKNGESVNHHDL